MKRATPRSSRAARTCGAQSLGLSTAGGQASLATLFDEPDFAIASFLLAVLGEEQLPRAALVHPRSATPDADVRGRSRGSPRRLSASRRVDRARPPRASRPPMIRRFARGSPRRSSAGTPRSSIRPGSTPRSSTPSCSSRRARGSRPRSVAVTPRSSRWSPRPRTRAVARGWSASASRRRAPRRCRRCIRGISCRAGAEDCAPGRGRGRGRERGRGRGQGEGDGRAAASCEVPLLGSLTLRVPTLAFAPAGAGACRRPRSARPAGSPLAAPRRALARATPR